MTTLRVDERRVWIVEILVYGRPVRFGTERAQIPTDDGDVVIVREGLEDLALPTGEGDVAELSVAISIGADDLEGIGGSGTGETSGWAGLYAAGYDLERQPARLLRWRPGTTWEATRVVLRGLVEEVAIGGPLEPLEFTLARSPSRQSRPMIPADAKVTIETWPVRAGYIADENILGAWYPLVLGYPGSRTAFILGTLQTIDTPRTPGLLVEHDDLPLPAAALSQVMVAGHPVDADSVRVYQILDSGNSPSEIRPVFQVQDLHGRTVSVINFAGSALGHPIGTDFYVSWSTETGRGGGLPRLDGTGAVRGMGELIRRLLEEYSDLEIDTAAMESERVYLDRFKIDTYVNDPPDDVWAWIQSELLQLVPTKVVEGPRGFWVRLMRYDATLLDAVGFLDGDDPRVSRVSKLTSTGWDQVANQLRLDYAANRNAPNYTAHRLISGDPEVADPNAFFDFRCGVSRRRLERNGVASSGIRELVLGGGEHLWERETVDAVLRLRAAELAIPHKRGTWSVPEGLEDAFRPGDVIAIRDTEVGLPVPRAALVDQVTIGLGETVFDLIVLEDPARIARALGA